MPGRVATVLVPAAVIAAVAWSSGGYFPRSWGALLLVEAIVVAAAAILADRIERNGRAAVLVGALLGLVLWQVASRAWAVAPDAAILEAQRTLVYAGAAAAAFLVVPRRRADMLVVSVLAGAALVTIGGVVEHAALSGEPPERLEAPVGYANAAGILATTTLVLGVGLAADRARGLAALGAGLAVPASVALYLTLSRGAMIAAFLGLIVLAVTSGWSGMSRIALAVVPCGGAVLMTALLGEFTDADLAARELAGLGALAALAVASAGLVAWAPDVSRPRVSGRLGSVVVAVTAGLLVVGILAVGTREVREIRSAPASQQGAPDRLLSTSTSLRSDYWDVAIGMVEREPLLGEGAGGFERTWLAERPALLFVRDAHNAYLETLAELGPVGLGLLLLALVMPLLGARRVTSSAAGRAALAAYAALLAHALLDWDWEIPAVTLCTVLLGVALVRLAGNGGDRPLSGAARAAVGGGAALLAVVAVVVHAGNGAIAEAHEALDRGDVVGARDHARARQALRAVGGGALATAGRGRARDGTCRAGALGPPPRPRARCRGLGGVGRSCPRFAGRGPRGRAGPGTSAESARAGARRAPLRRTSLSRGIRVARCGGGPDSLLDAPTRGGFREETHVAETSRHHHRRCVRGRRRVCRDRRYRVCRRAREAFQGPVRDPGSTRTRARSPSATRGR